MAASTSQSQPQPVPMQVLDDRRKWWKVRDQQGQEGYVPYNILTPHPGPHLVCSQSPARSLVSHGRLRSRRRRGWGQNPGPGIGRVWEPVSRVPNVRV